MTRHDIAVDLWYKFDFHNKLVSEDIHRYDHREYTYTVVISEILLQVVADVNWYAYGPHTEGLHANMKHSSRSLRGFHLQ
jgi:hypothetical protein